MSQQVQMIFSLTFPIQTSNVGISQPGIPSPTWTTSPMNKLNLMSNPQLQGVQSWGYPNSRISDGL